MNGITDPKRAMTLYGYIGGGEECSDYISYNHPVFSSNDEFFAVMKDKWSRMDRSSYRRISRSELEYVSPLPHDDGMALSDGDLVWIMPADIRDLYARLQAIHSRNTGIGKRYNLPSFRREKENRTVYDLGSLDEYIRISNTIFDASSEAMEHYLFDKGDKIANRRRADDMHKLMNACSPRDIQKPYSPYLQKYLENGLYYLATGKKAELDLLIDDIGYDFPTRFGDDQEIYLHILLTYTQKREKHEFSRKIHSIKTMGALHGLLSSKTLQNLYVGRPLFSPATDRHSSRKAKTKTKMIYIVHRSPRLGDTGKKRANPGDGRPFDPESRLKVIVERPHGLITKKNIGIGERGIERESVSVTLARPHAARYRNREYSRS